MRRSLATLALAVTVAGCTAVDGHAPPPGDRSWAAVAAGPLSARHDALGVWDGRRFVVVGGSSGVPCPPQADCAPAPALTDGAAYDPATGTWQPIPAAPVALGLGDQLVAAGGRLYALTRDAAFLGYDGAAWTTLPSPPGAGQLLDAGGTPVLVAGTDEHGATVDAAFDAANGAWRVLPDDPLGPSFNRMAAWAGDRLLLAAQDLVPDLGATKPSLVRLATLDAALTTWAAPTGTEVLHSSLAVAAGTVVWTGTGHADGGQVGNWGRAYPEGGMLTVATGQWRPLPQPPRPAGSLPIDPALSTGGRVTVGGHLLDPATGDWLRVSDPPGGQRFAATLVAGPDLLFLWGGAVEHDAGRNLGDGHLLRV
ncbi:hypothetical protein ACFPIJ_19620 [Dactylosporangium cerinum]|uniref:Uncharacterized protein n=1 Tax=Dactylosporangium cerinum TaxID=1434730 RepID=A0ABV9VV67_9ACTN